MNATEKGRRSDALYYDNVTRRNLCDRIANLESDLTESKAENDKLRERIHELEMEGSDHFYRTAYAEDANRTLDAENAKLRELAVLNWEWAHSCCGNNCKMQTDGCGYQIDRECNYEREIYDRMHELGIEIRES